MKKVFLIAIIAFIAMIGTASAYDAILWDAAGNGEAANPIQIKPGFTKVLSYHVENVAPAAVGVAVPYDHTVVALAGGAQVSDITVTLPATFTPAAETDTDIGSIQIDLASTATVGAQYRVTVKAGDEQIDIDFGSASRNIESIPEFPTIALPVAAILGLAFFFQRRKEE